MGKRPVSRPEILEPILGSMPQVKVHRITDDEFKQLASGGLGQQTELSFALALLPMALTILITLLTVTIPEPRKYNSFLIFLILFAVQGVYFSIRWWRTGSSLKGLIHRIEARMPESSGPEQISGRVLIIEAEAKPGGALVSPPEDEPASSGGGGSG